MLNVNIQTLRGEPVTAEIMAEFSRMLNLINLDDLSGQKVVESETGRHFWIQRSGSGLDVTTVAQA